MNVLGYFVIAGVLLFFGLIGFAYYRVILFQRALRLQFPNEASGIVPVADFCGLNRAQGLLFLWDPRVVRLSVENRGLGALRKGATRAICFGVAVPLLGFCGVILWIAVMSAGVNH